MQYLKQLTTILQMFLPKPIGSTISCQAWVLQLQGEIVLTEVYMWSFGQAQHGSKK